MFKTSFILAATIMMSLSQAQAKGGIFCKYPTGQTLLYETPGSIDIARPDASGYGGAFQVKKIPLIVNKVGPIDHTVSVVSERAKFSVTYSHKDQFFVNDLKITYVLDAVQKKEFVFGTHKTDYNVITLTCTIKH